MLPGLVFPANGTRVYQEDWNFEQESKSNEIINRSIDEFTDGVVSGGSVVLGDPQTVSLPETTVAYDETGKRVHVPSIQNFLLPNNTAGKIVIRFKEIQESKANPDGTSLVYSKAGYEVLLRTGVLLEGDIPLRDVVVSLGTVTLGNDLRKFRSVQDVSIVRKSSIVDTLESDDPTTVLSGKQGKFLSQKITNSGKIVGEIFMLSDLRQPSLAFPAYCLAMGNGALWKSGNPGGPGNISGNWNDLVDLLRAIPLSYDPLNQNAIDFTVTSWSYSGTTITLNFAYTASPLTKETLILRALHEDAFVHNSNTTIGGVYSAFENVSGWKTITLVDGLRNTSDVVQVPPGTYQITSIAGGATAAGQIRVIHSATPTGTAKTESRLVRFYPNRIQDSGANADVNAAIKALHWQVEGRGFYSPSASQGDFVAGLRIRDFMQGHMHTSEQLIAGKGPGGTGIGGSVSDYQLYFINNYVKDPRTDGTKGTPRTRTKSHGPQISVYPYIWGVSWTG